jgi:predicted RNase H-like HicB family nuclease
MENYLIIIEETPSGYSAYSPDLPGCVATSESREGVEQNMRSAIQAHIRELANAGEAIPPAKTQAAFVSK